MDKQMMNILVLGTSGAGKSTLIKAISGKEVAIGTGEGITQKISVYESDIWNFRLIDTKGFEYHLFEQWKTISQVKKFTKLQLEENQEEKELGIDAVWYCIEGTARRTFVHNIEMMNKAVKEWKNVPVFAVITKSYSEPEIQENIVTVRNAFSKVKNVNLKDVIPVVAAAFSITEDIKVFPKGLEALCNQTLACADEAKRISAENRARMILEQKRFTSQAIITGAAASAAVIGAIPFNFADAALLVPLETGLTKGIFKVYQIDFSAQLISAIIGSAAITGVAKTIVRACVEAIPVAGQVINGVVAGIIVFTLGESIVAVSEAIKKGIIEPEKIEDVTAFISEKAENNPIIGSAISYLKEHTAQIEGKSAKELLKGIIKFNNENSNT